MILKISAKSDLYLELFLKMSLLKIIKIIYEIQGGDNPISTLEKGVLKPKKGLFPDSKKGNTKPKMLGNGHFGCIE